LAGKPELPAGGLERARRASTAQRAVVFHPPQGGTRLGPGIPVAQLTP
jgi:hypothetical protein